MSPYELFHCTCFCMVRQSGGNPRLDPCSKDTKVFSGLLCVVEWRRIFFIVPSFRLSHILCLTVLSPQLITVYLLFSRSQEDELNKTHSPTPSLETGDGNEDCIVCSDNPRELVFHPCNHAVCCEPCGSRVKKCLICRAPVGSRSKVNSFP